MVVPSQQYLSKHVLQISGTVVLVRSNERLSIAQPTQAGQFGVAGTAGHGGHVVCVLNNGGVTLGVVDGQGQGGEVGVGDVGVVWEIDDQCDTEVLELLHPKNVGWVLRPLLMNVFTSGTAGE